MAHCINEYGAIVEDNQRVKDSTSADISALVETYQYMEGHTDKLLGGLVNPAMAFTHAEDFIGRYTEFKTLKEYESKADPTTREFVRDRVADHIKMLGQAGVDFNTVREDLEISDGMRRIYNTARKHAKGSKALHQLTSGSWLFKNFELLSDRHRVISQHPVAGELFTSFETLKNYMQKRRGQLLNRVMQATKEFEDQGVSPIALRHYIQHLDGQFAKSDEEIADMFRDDKDFFDGFYKTAQKKSPGVDANKAAMGFVEILHEFQKRWNIINYGVENPKAVENYNPRDEAYEDSIVGFIYRAGNMVKNMVDKRIMLNESDEHLSSPEKEYSKLFAEDGFNIRTNNYVPSKRDDADVDIFDRIILDSDEDLVRLPGVPNFLHNRNKMMNTATDFFDVLNSNIMAYTFSLEQVARYSSLNTMLEALNKTPEWTEQNQTVSNTIRFYAETSLGHMKEHKNDKGPMVEAARNLATSLSAMGTFLLVLPNSAVSNYMGGWLGMFSQFGSDWTGKQKSFKKAMTSGETDPLSAEVAGHVKRVVETELTSLGQMQDYIVQNEVESAEHNGMLVDVTRKLRDLTMKIADKNTSGGIIKLFPELLTMRGSEGHMREYATGILYDLVKREVDIRQKTGKSVDADAIRTVIDDYKLPVLRDVDKALGNFSIENKPFWSWARLKYADTLPGVMMGSLLNTWYMFRHVATHNANMMLKAGVDTFDFSNNLSMKDRAKTGGLGAFLVGMMLMMYDIGTRTFARGVSRFPSPLNVNPFQEAVTTGHFMKAVLGPSLNLNMSEAEADEAYSNMMRLAGGVFTGQALEKSVDSLQEESQSYKVFSDLFKSASNTLNFGYALPKYLHAMGADEYYDTKSMLRQGLDTPIPFMNYSNDYLNFVSKVVPLATRGETDQDSSKLRGYKIKDFKNIIIGLTGFNPHRAPEFYNTYDKSTQLYLQRERLYKTARTLYPNEADYENSVFSKIIEQISKYGKVYAGSLKE